MSTGSLSAFSSHPDSGLASLVLERCERPFWLFDFEELRIVWANRAALEVWSAATIEELGARDASASRATLLRLENYRRRFAAGESVTERWTFYPRGRPITLLCRSCGLRTPDGRECMLVEASAIPDAERNELDLRGFEALRHTSVMFTFFSEAGEVLMQNPAAQSAFGHPDESQNRFVRRFADEDIGQLVLDQLAAGEPFAGDVEVVTREGTRWHTLEARAILDPLTGRTAILVDQRDATERRRAQEAIRASEQHFRAVCLQAPIGIIQTRADGSCVFVNARWEEITGMPADDALGSGWLIALHPDDRARIECEWAGLVAAPREALLQHRYRHALGHDVWVVMSVVPVRDGAEQITSYVGAVSDVTKSVQSEQRFAIAFEHSNDAVMMHDENAVILDANRAAMSLFGASSKSDLLGQNPIVLSPERQPCGRSSLELAKERMSIAVSRGANRFEWLHERLDGSEFSAEVAITSVSLLGRQAFLSTLHDVTERKRSEEEMLRSREAALEASRLKSQFLANMSHEIRTPMNGVLGMLVLALGTELSPEQREYLAAAQASAEGLLAIINDILDLSKIEAGKLSLERVLVPVEELLRGSLRATAARAHAKGIELFVELRGDVPDAIVGDPVRIHQILTNLIGNAIKFTELGHVAVVVERVGEADESSLRISIEDTGIGISPERREKIFHAFQQADNSTTRRYGGTGLGLTICRELTAMMNGQLTLSTEEGLGSTFSVSLPLGTHALPPHTQASASGVLAGRTVLVVEDHHRARATMVAALERAGAAVHAAATPAHAFAIAMREVRIDVALIDQGLGTQNGAELPRLLRRYASCAACRFVLLRSQEAVSRRALEEAGFAISLEKPLLPSEVRRVVDAERTDLDTSGRLRALPRPSLHQSVPLRVLVVEDHPVNAHFLTALLQRRGHHVVHASNGVRALLAYESEVFDVILMDVQMPEMDGLEATRRVRRAESDGRARVPIVALTANAMKGDEAECLAAGMDYYVPKPIDPDVLDGVLRGIRPVLGGRAALVASASAGGDRRDAERPKASEREAPPSAAPFDRQELLQRACGDARFQADLIRIFLGTQEEMLRDVESSVERADSECVRHAAHKLKGALQLICAAPAAAVARDLERAGRSGDAQAASELLRHLREEMLRLRRALGDTAANERT